MDHPVSERDWRGIRAAARRLDWDEVVRRAEALGWSLLAKYARRAPFEVDAIRVIAYSLRLDQGDDVADPFADHA